MRQRSMADNKEALMAAGGHHKSSIRTDITTVEVEDNRILLDVSDLASAKPVQATEAAGKAA